MISPTQLSKSYKMAEAFDRVLLDAAYSDSTIEDKEYLEEDNNEKMDVDCDIDCDLEANSIRASSGSPTAVAASSARIHCNSLQLKAVK
ncbi:hypothetical protein Y032_0042g607 [Ancylostoma ceylanicum]|uniref:Uncharacterized protein n=1 Tax=Ancylostoma ceylanicum TaxID=53326 RepID=A0A016UGH6_9BILA|nr:hypothetical protein Y032_0042g607 [Ancylostoma ceylanicum]